MASNFRQETISFSHPASITSISLLESGNVRRKRFHSAVDGFGEVKTLLGYDDRKARTGVTVMLIQFENPPVSGSVVDYDNLKIWVVGSFEKPREDSADKSVAVPAWNDYRDFRPAMFSGDRKFDAMECLSKAGYDGYALALSLKSLDERNACGLSCPVDKTTGVCLAGSAPPVGRIRHMKHLVFRNSLEIAEQEVIILRAVKPGSEVADLSQSVVSINREMIDIIDTCQQHWIEGRLQHQAAWNKAVIDDQFIRVKELGFRVVDDRLCDDFQRVGRNDVIMIE